MSHKEFLEECKRLFEPLERFMEATGLNYNDSNGEYSYDEGVEAIQDDDLAAYIEGAHAALAHYLA